MAVITDPAGYVYEPWERPRDPEFSRLSGYDGLPVVLDPLAEEEA